MSGIIIKTTLTSHRQKTLGCLVWCFHESFEVLFQLPASPGPLPALGAAWPLEDLGWLLQVSLWGVERIACLSMLLVHCGQEGAKGRRNSHPYLLNCSAREKSKHSQQQRNAWWFSLEEKQGQWVGLHIFLNLCILVSPLVSKCLYLRPTVALSLFKIFSGPPMQTHH